MEDQETATDHKTDHGASGNVGDPSGERHSWHRYSAALIQPHKWTPPPFFWVNICRSCASVRHPARSRFVTAPRSRLEPLSRPGCGGTSVLRCAKITKRVSSTFTELSLGPCNPTSSR